MGEGRKHIENTQRREVVVLATGLGLERNWRADEIERQILSQVFIFWF